MSQAAHSAHATAPAPAWREHGPMLLAGASLLFFLGPGASLLRDAPLGLEVLLLVWLFGVILWGAVGVMRHAEEVAHVLGEPYGTLVLTLSAITVEIALILSVMMAGEAAPALARDTMFAVLMIIVNGLLGTALLLGGLRHRQQIYNLEGARAFLVVLTPLAVCAMALPNHVGLTAEAVISPPQAVIFGLLTLSLYGVFLALQTSRHRGFFTEVQEGAAPQPARTVDPEARRRVVRHGVLLLLTLVPVAMLADHLAGLLDRVDRQVGLPPEVGGVLIAILILAPEGLAALRAAWNNQLQRAVNILLGSALSTIGLTVPVVLIAGTLLGHDIILGLPADYVTLLALTLVTASLTLGTSKTDMLKGAVHLVLFGIYLMLIALQ